jgi:hypothetical protein
MRKLNIQSAIQPQFYIPFIGGAFFMLIMIIHYGANTPFWDQWEMVPLFEAVSHHNLTFADLWRQHNEHRIFFPNLLLLANAYLTDWNTRIETLIGLCFSLVTAGLILFMASRTIVKRWLGLIASILVAAWFFSPAQWENWLWGWQVEWFMCMTAITISIFFLTRRVTQSSRRGLTFFIIAILSGIIASYSLAGGLLVWPVGLFILWIKKQQKKFIGTWILIGVISTFLYYYHYVTPPAPNGATTVYFFQHPLAYIEFFLTYLGGPIGSVGSRLQAPALVGAMLFLLLIPCLYLVWQRRDKIEVFLPWLAFILFGLLAGLSTGVGRLPYGVGFALSSRYTAFSSIYLIGVVMLIITLLDNLKRPSKEFLATAALSIVFISLPLLTSSYVTGWRGFRSQSVLLAEIKACTHEPNPSNACLSLTYPNPSIVRPRLAYIKAKHWAGY